MKSKQLWLSKIKIIFICITLASCGVKGRPQAPLVETPIGYGSPEADELQSQKKPSGTTP